MQAESGPVVDESKYAEPSVQAVPEIAPPKSGGGWFSSGQIDERKQYEKDGSQSHNVRRLAAYGGVIMAGILYLSGLAAIALFLGLLPCYPRVDASMWHIVVSVLVALFTVPTVLLVAILKVTSPAQTDELPATAHEALGKMLEKVVDKIFD